LTSGRFKLKFDPRMGFPGRGSAMIEDEERRAFDEQPRAANDNGYGALRPRIDAALNH
jgi:hypothetical protein